MIFITDFAHEQLKGNLELELEILYTSMRKLKART